MGKFKKKAVRIIKHLYLPQLRLSYSLYSMIFLFEEYLKCTKGAGDKIKGSNLIA